MSNIFAKTAFVLASIICADVASAQTGTTPQKSYQEEIAERKKNREILSLTIDVLDGKKVDLPTIQAAADRFVSSGEKIYWFDEANEMKSRKNTSDQDRAVAVNPRELLQFMNFEPGTFEYFRTHRDYTGMAGTIIFLDVLKKAINNIDAADPRQDRLTTIGDAVHGSLAQMECAKPADQRTTSSKWAAETCQVK